MKTMVFGALAALLYTGAAAQTVQYTIDPSHTYPSFEADHMGISVWRGKLNKSAGKVTLDRAAKQGTVEVVMELASIDFGLDAMNKWARGDGFFHVAKHPKAIYKGKLVDFNEAGPTRVEGELTLHGVTKPVELKINAFKCVPHPLFKRELCGADAQAVFDREEFGLPAGKAYGFRMDVALRIQVEAVADR
jgi:polyisoprenoid-binding protein YceI